MEHPVERRERSGDWDKSVEMKGGRRIFIPISVRADAANTLQLTLNPGASLGLTVG